MTLPVKVCLLAVLLKAPNGLVVVIQTCADNSMLEAGTGFAYYFQLVKMLNWLDHTLRYEALNDSPVLRQGLLQLIVLSVAWL